jgi:hypothetical protein
MPFDDYQLIRIAVADGICRATIDNPPINLLTLDLILELGRWSFVKGVALLGIAVRTGFGATGAVGRRADTVAA